MKIQTLAAVFSLVFAFVNFALASEDHDHGPKKKTASALRSKEAAPSKESPHAKHEDHDENHGGEGESHDSHEGEHAEHGKEENSQAGPEKGILAANADDGIKLSPEAEKHFEVRKMKVATLPVEVPRTAVVTGGTEVNLFRFRDGFYKRIDFVQIRRTAKTIILQSSDLKVGDQIALTGLGFLRTAESAAFGGAPEGHSH